MCAQGSPDVHVVSRTRKITIFYHCYGIIDRDQVTFKGTSFDGIHFHFDNSNSVGPFYFRQFTLNSKIYAVAKNKNKGAVLLSREGSRSNHTFVLRTNFIPNCRHVSIYTFNASMGVIFFTIIGDAPESIYMSLFSIGITDYTVNIYRTCKILSPFEIYEGALEPVNPSSFGGVKHLVNQLRDPFIFHDRHSSKFYLYYSFGGESGIAVALLQWNTTFFQFSNQGYYV